ncbi:MAG: hypothetical protein A2086_03510 [Spirochaetes bacterium GWD1_27_9]|nr:MAG: hypothetical protein A2Z98_09830 [Spirochaetes bacterium GWB1_27_13]OHD25347.1 MAG: hypothetical protein A2Y34_00050 [Spirochaetes bacterium GWC1_27_15]OHD31123.1 MAG: hypothetical protein A2086_03510 [Spirochaetes bacterium GWD1_27_9]
MKNYLPIFLLILVLSCSKGDILTMDNSINDRENRVSQYIDSLIENNITPGLQYAIINEKDIIYSKATGYMDVKNKINMKLDTTMNIFSVTKLFTGVSILQLQEQNKLNIYDDVSKYIKDIPYKNIKIIDILSHSSGIPNPIIGNFFIHWKEEHKEFKRDDFLNEVLQKNNKLKFEPTKKMLYSNLGYAILGKVIENVSSLDYETYVKTNIIKVLNIKDQDMSLEVRDLNLSAKPYINKKSLMENFMTLLLKGGKWQDEGNWKYLERQFYFDFPSHGGIVANSLSLSSFLKDLLQDKSKLLSNDSKRMFFTEIIRDDKKNRSVAISWMVSSNNGNKYYSHQGGGVGYASLVRIYPDKKLASVLLVNTTTVDVIHILDNLDYQFMK